MSNDCTVKHTQQQPHQFPVHISSRPSLLSHEHENDKFVNFSGLMNLVLITMFSNLASKFFSSSPENISKWFESSISVAALVGPYIILTYTWCFIFYRFRARRDGLVSTCIVFLVWPWVYCRQFVTNPILGTVLTTFAICFGLKMVSFQLYISGKANNIYPATFAYFIAAPTLCFQEAYPMVNNMRMEFIARRSLALLSTMASMLLIFHDYLQPAMELTVHQGITIPATLSLSTYTVMLWLLGFYAFFHCYLNIIAEMTLFGDRMFYADWWNAGSIEEYWRLWNIPMHNWLKRHIYRVEGLGRWGKMIAVFLLSALLHEYVVAAPTGLLCGWAFMVIAFQFPLIMLSRMLKPHVGGNGMNFLFWILFCIVGQPLLLLGYYHAWRQRTL